MTVPLNRLHRNSDSVFDLYIQETPKTANYTVLPGDNGRLFTNFGASGAVTFTLPALARGFKFGFLVLADQNVTVACNEGDKIVWKNDAAADSLAFSTAGSLVGGYLEFFTNSDGTKWYVKKLCENTVTAAT